MVKKSNFQLSSSLSEGIVNIVVKGDLSENDTALLRSEVIEIIRGSNARAVLVDVREATGPHKIVDAYYRARDLPRDISRLRVAVVDLPENQEYKAFFENTAVNAGRRIKWFTDVESAIIWLKSSL